MGDGVGSSGSIVVGWSFVVGVVVPGEVSNLGGILGSSIELFREREGVEHCEDSS